MLVFHHIPKTGGTSLGVCIKIAYPKTSQFLKNCNEIIKVPPAIHFVYGHDMWGVHFYRECKYITLLRDPFERFLSGWHHLKARGRMNLSFQDYMNSGYDVQPKFNQLVASLTEFPATIKPYHVAKAIQVLRERFTIGFTDQFNKSLNIFNKTFGLVLKPGPQEFKRQYSRNFAKLHEYRNRFESLNRADCDLYKIIRDEWDQTNINKR